MTPTQLKEHNTMLLLLKEKEKEKEYKEKENMEERENNIDKILSKKELLETIPELEHEIEELEWCVDDIEKEIETINTWMDWIGKEIANNKNDILVIKNNISISEKKLSDKIEGVYKTTSEIKNELNSLKDNDSKPKVERIIEKVELPKDLARLSDIPSLKEYAKKDEVYTKEETYHKQEVYNKREIDSKIQNTQWGKRYSEIKDDITDWYFTWSSEKIQEQIDANSPTLTYAIATKTANYTILSTDFTILCDCTSGNITITLPTLDSWLFNIKKIDSSANTVTIDTQWSELIDGTATKTIGTQYTGYQVQTDWFNYYIL